VERGRGRFRRWWRRRSKTHARYAEWFRNWPAGHLRAIVPVVRAARGEAGVALGIWIAIAVTAGPGLAGALLWGLRYAKALAFAQGLPLIAVNHWKGIFMRCCCRDGGCPEFC